jgi:hypothetical protein
MGQSVWQVDLSLQLRVDPQRKPVSVWRKTPVRAAGGSQQTAKINIAKHQY